MDGGESNLPLWGGLHTQDPLISHRSMFSLSFISSLLLEKKERKKERNSFPFTLPLIANIPLSTV